MPSLRAQLVELLGDDDASPPRRRLTVVEAVARTGPGEVCPARIGGCDVAVAVLADGASVVVADRCPHDGGPLSDGYLDDGRLVCARHGWEFDLATGRPVGRTGCPLDVLAGPGQPGTPGNFKDS